MERIIEQAIKMRERAYAPYSDFKVGAALLGASGKIYTGCNIENSAYSPTVCAERVAIFKAISEGEKNFIAIAVCGGKEKPQAVMPCGVCRQILSEFCNEAFIIYSVESITKYEKYTLGELLPNSFKLKE